MRDEVLVAAICEWSWPYYSHDQWTDESGNYSGEHSWYCDSEDYPAAIIAHAETTPEFGWVWTVSLYELDDVSGRNELMETFAGDTADGLREVVGRFAESIGATRVSAAR